MKTTLKKIMLKKTTLTAPIAFTVAGVVTTLVMAELPSGAVRTDAFLPMAELGLVLLLFTDASRIDLKLLGSMGSLPARLLSVGMLLTIALGTAVAAPATSRPSPASPTRTPRTALRRDPGRGPLERRLVANFGSSA